MCPANNRNLSPYKHSSGKAFIKCDLANESLEVINLFKFIPKWLVNESEALKDIELTPLEKEIELKQAEAPRHAM